MGETAMHPEVPAENNLAERRHLRGRRHNLYMVGRCISGDFLPMVSYRVTGSFIAMGEGVGYAVGKLLVSSC